MADEVDAGEWGEDDDRFIDNPIDWAREAAEDVYSWGSGKVDAALDAVTPKVSTELSEEQLARNQALTGEFAGATDAASARATQAPMVGVETTRYSGPGWQPTALGGTGGAGPAPVNTTLGQQAGIPATTPTNFAGALAPPSTTPVTHELGTFAGRPVGGPPPPGFTAADPSVQVIGTPPPAPTGPHAPAIPRPSPQPAGPPPPQSAAAPVGSAPLGTALGGGGPQTNALTVAGGGAGGPQVSAAIAAPAGAGGPSPYVSPGAGAAAPYQGTPRAPGTVLGTPPAQPTQTPGPGGQPAGYYNEQGQWVASPRTATGDPARQFNQPGVTPTTGRVGDRSVTPGAGGAGGAGVVEPGTAIIPGTVGFDATQTDETRAAQIAAAGMAFNAATGQGPSAAGIQSRLDMDRATRLAQAQGAAMQGRSVGGALTGALDAGARARADISAQAQATRAAEMAAARGQAIGAAGQIRGQDTAVASEIAQLQLLASQGNQDAVIRLRQIDDQFALGRGDQLLASTSLAQRQATDIDALKSQQYSQQQALLGGLIEGGSELGAAYLMS